MYVIVIAIVILLAKDSSAINILGHCYDGDPCTTDDAVDLFSETETPSALLTIWDFPRDDRVVGEGGNMRDITKAFGTQLDSETRLPDYRPLQTTALDEKEFWYLFFSDSAKRMDTIVEFKSGAAYLSYSRPNHFMEIINPIDYLGYGMQGNTHNGQLVGRLTYTRISGSEWKTTKDKSFNVHCGDCVVVYAAGNMAFSSCDVQDWRRIELDPIANIPTGESYEVDVFFVIRKNSDVVLGIKDFGTISTASCSHSKNPYCVVCEYARDCPAPSSNQCTEMTCVDGVCLEIPEDSKSCEFENPPRCVEGRCAAGQCVPVEIPGCCEPGNKCAEWNYASPCKEYVYDENCECVGVPLPAMDHRTCDDSNVNPSRICVDGECVLGCETAGSPCRNSALDPVYDDCSEQICDSSYQCVQISDEDGKPCQQSGMEGYCFSGRCVPDSCPIAGESPCHHRGPHSLAVPECMESYCGERNTCEIRPSSNYIPCSTQSVCFEGECIEGCPVPGELCEGEPDSPCTKFICSIEHVCEIALGDDFEECEDGYCIQGECLKGACLTVGQMPCISRGETNEIIGQDQCKSTVCGPDHLCHLFPARDNTLCHLEHEDSAVCWRGRCVAACLNPGSACDGPAVECGRRVCAINGSCIVLPAEDGTECESGYCFNGQCRVNTCSEIGQSPCYSRGGSDYKNAEPCVVSVCGPDHTCVTEPVEDYTSCSLRGDPSPAYCYGGLCTKTCKPEGWSSCSMPGESPVRYDPCKPSMCMGGSCKRVTIPDGTQCGSFKKCSSGNCYMMF